MKRFFLVMFVFLSSNLFCGDVSLGVVYNHSDLTLTHASTKPGKNKNKALTTQIKLANKQNKPSVFKTYSFNHPIGTHARGYIAFDAQDEHKNQYEIAVHTSSALAVQEGRSKATHGRAETVKAMYDVSEGSYCAQVVIKKNGIVEHTSALPYDIDNADEDVALNLSILGSKGVYTARLSQAQI